jgi:hypothetical protein
MSKTIKKYCRRETLAFAILACALMALTVLFFSTPSSSAAPPKKKIDTPILTIVAASPSSIDVQVCAPTGTNATGLPAGFSVQWMTQADYDAYGWPVSSDDPSNPSSFCKASFSGNASGSRYNLSPGECVTVRIGDLLFDNGASTLCPDELLCDTAYVFRAFGHATSTLTRSDFSATVGASTTPCGGGDTGGCTLTQGYWKTHNDAVCAVDPTSPLCVAWPVSSLTLGTVAYDEAQLLSIYNTTPGGNGLISLAHQLITAKLNIANGADPTDASASIAAADALIGSLVVPPVGSGFLAPASTSALTTALNDYNTGLSGPGHCGSEPPAAPAP